MLYTVFTALWAFITFSNISRFFISSYTLFRSLKQNYILFYFSNSTSRYCWLVSTINFSYNRKLRFCSILSLLCRYLKFKHLPAHIHYQLRTLLILRCKLTSVYKYQIFHEPEKIIRHAAISLVIKIIRHYVQRIQRNARY